MPDEDEEMWMEICTEIVCDSASAGEWTGDDWVMFFEDSVLVRWEYATSDDTLNDLDYDVKKTAEKIFDEACALVKEYQPEWISLDEAINTVYREAIQKYGE
jgi:hypothetical protein